MTKTSSCRHNPCGRSPPWNLEKSILHSRDGLVRWSAWPLSKRPTMMLDMREDNCVLRHQLAYSHKRRSSVSPCYYLWWWGVVLVWRRSGLKQLCEFYVRNCYFGTTKKSPSTNESFTVLFIEESSHHMNLSIFIVISISFLLFEKWWGCHLYKRLIVIFRYHDGDNHSITQVSSSSFCLW